MLSALTDLKNSNYLILSELLEMELKFRINYPVSTRGTHNNLHVQLRNV